MLLLLLLLSVLIYHQSLAHTSCKWADTVVVVAGGGGAVCFPLLGSGTHE